MFIACGASRDNIGGDIPSSLDHWDYMVLMQCCIRFRAAVSTLSSKNTVSNMNPLPQSQGCGQAFLPGSMALILNAISLINASFGWRTISSSPGIDFLSVFSTSPTLLGCALLGMICTVLFLFAQSLCPIGLISGFVFGGVYVLICISVIFNANIAPDLKSVFPSAIFGKLRCGFFDFAFGAGLHRWHHTFGDQVVSIGEHNAE